MKCLDNPIEFLNIKEDIIKKLKSHNILLVRDIWYLKRKELKNWNFNDIEINEIIVKLQLNGIDLNKRVY